MTPTDTMTDRTDAPQDGRRQRSARSRVRIVEAMFALIRAGDMNPSAAALAEEANVGIRTVFRHFDDVEGLYRQMAAQIEAEIMPILEEPYAARSWRGKLDEMISRRVRVYEHILPMKVAAGLRRHQSPYLMEDYQRFAQLERDGLHALLPASVTQDKALCAGLEMVTSFNGWRRLRQDQGLSRKEAEAAVRLAIGRLAGHG